MPNHRCIFSFGPPGSAMSVLFSIWHNHFFLRRMILKLDAYLWSRKRFPESKINGHYLHSLPSVRFWRIAFCMFSIHVANCLHYSQKNSNCKSITPRFGLSLARVHWFVRHVCISGTARYVYGYYIIDKQFKRKATWPSGLRRQNQAIANLVFGRGFESHCCQLIYTILILYSKKVKKKNILLSSICCSCFFFIYNFLIY